MSKDLSVRLLDNDNGNKSITGGLFGNRDPSIKPFNPFYYSYDFTW